MADIHTDRLILRTLRPDDADWITREIANPNVQVWLTSPPHPYTRADADGFIATHAQNHRYRVIDAAGVPQGVVSLDGTGAHSDLGYWLSEAAWGRGYMTEAARTLLDWHFAQSPAVVTSGWITGNAASRQVLTKLGFQPHGATRAMCHFRGTDVTVQKVRMTAPHWQALSAAR